MDAKAQKHLSESRKKPKRRRGHPAHLEVVKDNGAQAAGKIVVLYDGDDDDAPNPSLRKLPRRRNPAPKQDKELTKLDRLFLLAWKETYESRKRKLS